MKTGQERWRREIAERQNNLVPSDIIQNDQRFWRDIYQRRRSLSGFQKLGLFILAGSLVIGVGGLVTSIGWDSLTRQIRIKDLTALGAGILSAVVLLLSFLFFLSRRLR